MLPLADSQKLWRKSKGGNGEGHPYRGAWWVRVVGADGLKTACIRGAGRIRRRINPRNSLTNRQRQEITNQMTY